MSLTEFWYSEGTLAFDADFLCYSGDRVEMKLHANDLRETRLVDSNTSRDGLPPPYVLVELKQSLLGASAIRFYRAEGFILRAVGPTRQMSQAVEDWNKNGGNS